MAEQLNVAFLGGGINSAVGNVHKIALEMDKQFRLIAGYFSRHNNINKQTALQYGAENVYSSAPSLLDQEVTRLDAVIVLTPTPHHKEDVISCLNAGLPVICEKTLATSSTDAKQIESVLNEKNGFLAVIFNYTGYPMLRELRELITQGQLGKVEQIHIEMPQEGFSRLDENDNPVIPQKWRLHDDALPTISLDLGVHIHHLIDYLTAEKPVKVVAVQNSFGSFRQIVDNVSCIAQYSNDILCNIWFSKVALGHRNGLKVRVYGTEASAEWVQMQPEELYLHDNKGRRTILDRADIDVSIAAQARYNRFKAGHPAGFIEAFANHYADLASSIRQFKQMGRQVSVDHVFGIDKARQGLIMLEAIAQSSREHTWVAVE